MKEIDELTQAIAALEAQREALGDRVVEAALAPLREKLASLEQYAPAGRQRRLVTVLFLDLVNSTRLSQGLEPEEVQEIVGGALKRLSTPVEAHGGRVSQFMGDGFMAVFGLETIREDDARQAVRAGLAILSESHACAEDLERRFNIQGINVRVGINTGRVVAGRFSEAQSPVMGLTVTLAKRMEEAAQTGTVLISQFTYQHIRGAFEVEALEPVAAKGFSQPISVYRILAARPRTFRTATRGVEGIETGLVGRETELHQLQTALNHTIQAQETQLVTIVGEAGVGKSRLLYEFDRWVANALSQVIAFKARASPEMMTVPFSLLREMISYRLGVLTTDPVDETRRCLVDALSGALEDEPEMKAHFVGALLGFDFSGSPYLQGVEYDPKQLRQRGQLYLSQYFTAIAGEATTIFMLDDIHWADAPSVSFVTQFVRQCPQLALLVVCLGRPPLTERFPGWDQEEPGADQSPVQPESHPRNLKLVLDPLSREASMELLGEILRNVETLPDKLSQQILDKADGNPFYLEEYIQALIDAKVIHSVGRGGAWKLDIDRLGNLELPETLIALLEARLDNLTTAQRALVQQAAVIGQVFWRSTLQSVRGGKTISNEELEQLTRRGFINLQDSSTFAGTEEYRFHHEMLRNVAYQALLKPDRQAYHTQVAAWLIEATQSSGRAGEYTPVIAEHYETAGKIDLAADWFIKAGQQTRKQGAPAQARSFFDRAMTLLGSDKDASESPATLMRRWGALTGRNEVLGILGDTVARTADDKALMKLAEQMGDESRLAEACYRQGFTLEVSGQYQSALEVYNRGLSAAIKASDQPREALILGLKVICEVRLGDMEAAKRTSARALVVAELVGDDYILVRNLTNVSNYLLEVGDLARAARLIERQLEINRRTGNIEGELAGLSNQGYTFVILGMPEEGIATLQRCIALAEIVSHRRFHAYSGLNLALAHLRHSDPASAVAALEQCLPELAAMNDSFGYAVGQTYLALAEEQEGRVEEALRDFEQAAAALGEIGALPNRYDAEAGVARCLLRLGHLTSARKVADSLWDYLHQHAGAGMEFPVLAYETCADIFAAGGQFALARHAVGEGYGELLLRAGRISLPKWCQSFLEQVPEHLRIQKRWQENTQARQV